MALWGKNKIIMGKLFLIANIVLLLIFGYRFYDLYGFIKSKEKRELKKIDYDIKAVKKPVFKTYSQYRNIFGLKLNDASQAMNGVKGNKGRGLNELRNNNLIIRVKGIFIAGDREYAVISIRNSNSRKWAKKKIEIGDKISGFSVIDIQPGTLSLKNDEAKEITLRIFKKNEI